MRQGVMQLSVVLIEPLGQIVWFTVAPWRSTSVTRVDSIFTKDSADMRGRLSTLAELRRSDY